MNVTTRTRLTRASLISPAAPAGANASSSLSHRGSASLHPCLISDRPCRGSITYSRVSHFYVNFYNSEHAVMSPGRGDKSIGRGVAKRNPCNNSDNLLLAPAGATRLTRVSLISPAAPAGANASLLLSHRGSASLHPCLISDRPCRGSITYSRVSHFYVNFYNSEHAVMSPGRGDKSIGRGVAKRNPCNNSDNLLLAPAGATRLTMVSLILHHRLYRGSLTY